ncbi:hypothetical protein DSC45_00390 [Streptomyces sp. YIM 130001]|nr:hypothetical protein DSC45_00390 [Streptomyces sp. YIM 130001]
MKCGRERTELPAGDGESAPPASGADTTPDTAADGGRTPDDGAPDATAEPTPDKPSPPATPPTPAVPPVAPPTAPPPPAHAPPAGGPSPVGAFFGRAMRGDWAGSAKAAAWPLALLLVAAVAVAVPSYDQGDEVVVGFTDRLRIALALLLQGLGGGFEVGGASSGYGSSFGDIGSELSGGGSLSVVPLTVTALWAAALLRVRTLRARLVESAAGTAGLEAAVRVAAVVTGGVLVLGLFAQPEVMGVEVSSSPLLAALGALALCLLIAVGVLNRADLTRWLVERPGARALFAAIGTAVRALLIGLAVCSLVGFVVLTQIDDLEQEGLLLSLLVLPNIGAMVLGLGWGAGIKAEFAGNSGLGGGYESETLDLGTLGDEVNSWAVVGALALGLLCAVVMGMVTAARSRDRWEQLVSATVYLVLFLLLCAVAGLGLRASGSAGDLGGSGNLSVGTSVPDALLFGLLWIAAATFLGPYLLQMAGRPTGLVAPPVPPMPSGPAGAAAPGAAPEASIPGAAPEASTPGAAPESAVPPHEPTAVDAPAASSASPEGPATPDSPATPPEPQADPTPGTPPPVPPPGHPRPAGLFAADPYDPHTFHLGAGHSVPAKPPRSKAFVWTVTLVAAFVIGGGLTAGALLLSDGGNDRAAPGRDDKPVATSERPDSSPGESAADAPTEPADPSPSTSPDEGPTAEGPTEEATAPDGFHILRDPAGFSFAVPDVWSRAGEENGQITYAGSTGYAHFLIGVVPNSPVSSLENFRALELRTRMKSDYQRLKLEENTYRGRPGAVWEYTFTEAKTGRTVHAIDQGYVAEDGTEYAIYLTDYDENWPNGSEETFRVALDTWRLEH